MSKAIFKFNNGNGALLCSKCSVIIKEGYQFTKDEWKGMKGEKHIDAQYCDKCKKYKEGDRCVNCERISKTVGEHPVGILKEVNNKLKCPICGKKYNM